MKIKIQRSQLIDALKSVQNIVVGKGSLQILQNVMLEAAGGKLTLTTTDLDISIKSTVDCEVKEEGSSTLPVKLLFNIISKAVEGLIEVDIDKRDCALIKAGSARYRLNGRSHDEFPPMNSDEDMFEYELKVEVIREMLRKTVYAASQDDSRRSLKGVLLSFKNSKLTMVATDGRRLSMVESEFDFPKANERDIVLPLKTVQELLRSLSGEGELKISASKSRASFEIANLKIFSKLIDEVYPNYEQVIPKSNPEKIEIDRQLLIDAIERASVITIDEAKSIKLIFDDNKLLVSSAATEVGEAVDEVPIKFVGNRIEIMFNAVYLTECLRSIDDDTISIHLNKGDTPAVIRCSIPFLYVIMPLRIN